MLTYVELAPEYERLFSSCRIAPEHLAEVDKTVGGIVAGSLHYRDVEAITHVPWWFTGIIHSMECGGRFDRHLHNGDPLTDRTVHVPKGRPIVWNPPDDWESSAVDSLWLQGFMDSPDWTLTRALYRLEGYNGFGYRQHGINSPYLWSYSQHYLKGKFVADGKWDAEAVSQQCGAAALLRRMVDKGIVSFESVPGWRDAGASAT